MNIFTISSLVSFGISFALALIVFVRNYHHPDPRGNFFIVTALTVGIWCLFPAAAAIWPDGVRIVYAAAPFTVPAFFAFRLSFVEKKLSLRNKRLIIALYSIGALFLLPLFFSDLMIAGVRRSQSYFSLIPGPLYPVFIFYFTLICSYVFLKLFVTMKHADGQKRSQLKYVIASNLIAFFSAVIHFGNAYGLKEYFPHDILVDVCMVLLFYASVRYHLVDITPKLAVGTIFKTIPDFLVISDQNLKITLFNDKMLNVLGYSKTDLENQPLAGLFVSSEPEKFVCDLKEISLNNYPLHILAKNREKIPVVLNSCPVKQNSGFSGVVAIAHDMRETQKFIRELEKNKIDLENKNLELQDKYKDIEKFNKLMVDRELKMVELKKENAELKEQLEMNKK